MTTRLNLVGDKYGRLEVREFSHTENGRSYYKCLCACGVVKVVNLGGLRSGKTMSCGCLRNERFTNRTHGMTGTKVYQAWKSIKGRCFKDYSDSYKTYGALGITLDPDYVDDFEAFYKEVGDPPEDGKHYSIDRIDNNQGYLKGNMKWSDNNTQARNKSRQVNNSTGVTGVNWNCFEGHTYAVATWSDPVDGRPRNKKFAVNKHGLLPAFKLACNFRAEKLKELNSLGAGYSENHGKEKVVGL